MENSYKKDSNFLFGINVLGEVTGEFGLGTAARATLRAMEAANIPFAVQNYQVDWHRNLDDTYTNFFSQERPYPINLVHINPEYRLYHSLGTEYFQGKYNIAYWAWEMLEFPQAWQWAFDFFDEIWTLSNYCAEIISSVSPIPVVTLPPNISLPPSNMSREALGLPLDKFIFLFMFDFHSTLVRKNPIAIIEAFKKAFGKSNNDAQLLIKFSNAKYYPEQKERLLSSAENNSSIHFIDGHLLKEEVYGLINNCNCYVSLHRAEGFGLTMAEAMFYGKPVISTGYSSNIEFMNVNNSFLVQYELKEMPESGGPYAKGSICAAADVDHAAYLMEYIYQNYEEAKEVGAQAARDIRSLLAPQVIGNKIRKRLEYITKRMDRETKSSQFHSLRDKKALLENQIKGWKQTAKQLQTNLENPQFQVKSF